MRFEDERYVRVYTRDTTTWLMLPWQARLVFLEMLRKVDRAGILDVGEHGLDGLGAMLRLPSEIVEEGVSHLLRRKTIEQHGSLYVVPNFMRAQECAKSDPQRKREQRERDRAVAMARETYPEALVGDESHTQNQSAETVTNSVATVTNSDVEVTKEDQKSRPVTPSHARSRPVTNGHSVPSLAVPSQAVLSLAERENETPIPPSKRRGPPARAKTSIPDDFAVSPAIEAMCRRENLPDPHVVFRDFRDKSLAREYRYADWEAAFRAWLRDRRTRESYRPWSETGESRPVSSPDAWTRKLQAELESAPVTRPTTSDGEPGPYTALVAKVLP